MNVTVPEQGHRRTEDRLGGGSTLNAVRRPGSPTSIRHCDVLKWGNRRQGARAEEPGYRLGHCVPTREGETDMFGRGDTAGRAAARRRYEGRPERRVGGCGARRTPVANGAHGGRRKDHRTNSGKEHVDGRELRIAGRHRKADYHRNSCPPDKEHYVSLNGSRCPHAGLRTERRVSAPNPRVRRPVVALGPGPEVPTAGPAPRPKSHGPNRPDARVDTPKPPGRRCHAHARSFGPTSGRPPHRHRNAGRGYAPHVEARDLDRVSWIIAIIHETYCAATVFTHRDYPCESPA